MRVLLGTLLGGFLAVAAATNVAHADKRVALVIGNSSYKNVTRLDNPANDAQLMAATLRGVGFTLVGGGAQLDLDKAGIDDAVQKFGDQLVGADVALFYYAGHGVQIDGSNYLVPVGANPTRRADVFFQMLDVAVVLSQMEGSGAHLKMVILDACRNNPFAGRGLVRAAAGGLAQVQVPRGTLISYATQPGAVAQDGADGNSPYTKALAETLLRPGLGIFEVFNEVGLAVEAATGSAQQPWVANSAIEGRFFFIEPGAAPTRPADPTAGADEIFWQAIKDSKVSAVFDEFLNRFSGSPHAVEARARREELDRGRVAALLGPARPIQPIAPLVVARLNGAGIAASDLLLADEDIGAADTSTGRARRDVLVGYLVDLNLGAKAAEAGAIMSDDAVNAAMTKALEGKNIALGADTDAVRALLRKKILFEAMLASIGKAALTDAELHAVYDEAAKKIAGEVEVRARHILVETEPQAKAIVAQLKRGADFARLATEKSKDPAAAGNGGDLGYFTAEQMVPEFAEVVFKMTKGQISDPVKTQFGWHIIRLEDRRPRTAPTFDSQRSAIEAYVTRKAQTEFLTNLRSSAKIDTSDDPSYLAVRLASERAAAEGKADAMFNLGLVYQYGLGVEPSPVEARKWYKLAADAGHGLAGKGLAALADAK